ncbi:hypothetical protein BDW22DRAFT_1330541 [Trametopsis cervina]|nr:hypothetical protein BDW22DRAFT_1330541 [Trametopsis cervina]
MRPWGCVGELQAEPPQSVLPKEIEIVTDDYGLSTCPTHYFAVYASVASGHKWPRRIQIYPAQAFIVALFCSRLRFPPPEKPHVTPVGLEEVPEVADSSDTMTITTSALRLPVVHVCIPEPAVFPILFNYFHNTNMREFSLNLIGEWVPRSPDMSLQAYRMHFAAAIAKHHSPVKIWSYMVNVRATWRNMMALGVSDEELWAMIYHLWFVAWKAREIQTLKPGRYVGPKDASTGADSEKV